MSSYSNSTLTFTTPSGATGNTTIRARDGGITFAGTAANTRIIHSGTGTFSLVTKDAITASGDRFLLSGATGVSSIASQAGLTLSDTLTVGGGLHLLSGWDGTSGWTDLSVDTSTAPWTVTPATFTPTNAVVIPGASSSMSLGSLAVGGALVGRSGRDLTISGTATASGTVFLKAENDFTLSSAAIVTSWNAPTVGNASILIDAAGKFLNESSAEGDALVVNGPGGSWLVWTGNAAESKANGLSSPTASAATRQFNVDNAPTVSYDSSGAPVLSRSGVTLTGSGFLLPGDAPRGITVTANDASMTYGDAPVTNWGYTHTIDSSALILGDTEATLRASINDSSIARTTTASNTSNAGGAYTTSVSGLTSTLGYRFTYVDGVMTINRRPVTVTPDSGQSMTYGNTLNLTYTTDNLVNGDTLSGALGLNGTATNGHYNAGTYDILVGTLANSNYDISFTAGETFTVDKRTITVTADSGLTSIYGDPLATLTYTSSEALLAGNAFSGSLKLDGSANAGGYYNAGNYAILQNSLSAGNNYTINYVGANYDVTQRPLTVTPNAGQSSRYGDALPTITYTTDSLLSGDSLSGALKLDGSPTNGYYNAGKYNIVDGGLANSNYAITVVAGEKFTVEKRGITITANSGLTSVYGDPLAALTFTSSETLLAGNAFTGALKLDGSTNANNRFNAGTYAIVQDTLSAGDNYAVTYIGANYDVTRRGLIVTPDAGQSIIYGTDLPTVSYTANGLLAGDSLTGALGLDGSPSHGYYNAGSYDIVLGTLDNGNYAIDLSAGTKFTVDKRSITVTAGSGLGSVYGDTLAALTYTSSEALLDGNAFTGALRLDGSANANGHYDAGNYAIVQDTLSAGNNYAITYQSSDYLVAKRAISLSGVEYSRQYGDDDPAVLYSIGGRGLASGDSLSGAVRFDADARTGVGSYVIGQGSLGESSGNYDITWTDGLLTITPRALSVAADPATRLFGQPNPIFTWSITSGTLANADSLDMVLSTAADSASPVGIYDIDGVAVITGTDPANYSITYRGDGALVVTAAASNSGMDIEVLTPSTPSAPPTQSLTEIIAPPTDAAAFADVVALSNRPGLGPITVTEALASGRRLNDTQARLFSRFIVTRELWDSVVTPTGENGAIAESGITLEAVREHFLPALGTVTPDDWDFQAEYLPEDDTSDGDDGSPRRVRVTLTPR